MSTRDSVAITGAVLGLISLPLGWLTFKPNRIAVGTSLNLWESFNWISVGLIVLIWFTCLFLSFLAKRRWASISLGIAVNIIVILTLIVTGLAANRLLEGEESFARISLGAGFWITLAGAYVITFAVRRNLIDLPFLRHLLSLTGLIAIIIFLASGWLNNLSIVQEFIGREERFLQELVQHISLFGSSVAIGALIGITFGIWAARSNKVEKPVFFTANITQTIPSLALFGLLIAPLSLLSFRFPVLREMGIRGVGIAPAMIALVIYSLLPIVRNTFVSLRRIDPGVIDAGLGMGMSRIQIFFKLEVPLAASLVLEGVRIASVQAVGLATVAALIGAGGLGWFIFRGIGQAAPDLIILGAIPIIVLALIVDALMRIVIRLTTPKGLQVERS